MRNPQAIAKKAILSLTVLTAAATLFLTAACLGNEANPTAQPDRTQQALVEKVNHLNEEIANLQEELDELQSKETKESVQRIEPTKPTARPEPTTEPTTEPTPERKATMTESTPTRLSLPTSQEPGICGRNPAIQKEILHRLSAPLCQVITDPELFRITKLTSSLNMTEVKAGDFRGMVNLENLTVTAKNVEARAFVGLDNLKTMSLTVHTDGSIAPQAFAGLQNLERLYLTTSKPSSDLEETVRLPEIDHLPKLHTLDLDGRFGSQIALQQASEGILKNLPALEYLEFEIETSQLPPDTQGGNGLRLSEQLFDNNKALKVLNITGPSSLELHIPEGIFGSTPLLKEVHINEIRMLKIPRDMFQNLEKLEKLAIGGFLEEGEWKNHEITLSQISPLYNKILYGNERPSGFTLAETPDTASSSR